MTTTTEAEGAILKTDKLGRVRASAQRREHLLDEFERSGLSGAKFAALTGVTYSTFAGWVGRRRKQSGPSAPPAKTVDSVRWLEAVVREAQGPSLAAVVNVRLPNGAAIEIADINQVPLAAALVQALAKPAC